jgi:3-deoxy-D-arabinoheptulosonate-7-phosphate synthase (EC 2.5.1.54)
MLVVMEAHATAEQIEAVCAEIWAMGFTPHPMPGPTRTAIGITGNQGPIEQAGRLQRLPGVSQLIRVTVPYKLVSREFKELDTVVDVGGCQLVVMGLPLLPVRVLSKVVSKR